MATSTYIILIAINSSTSTLDVREICNELEGRTLKPTYLRDADIHAYILEKYPALAPEYVEVHSISYFMELNNDEEYHPDNWFMSYMYAQ